MSLRTAAEYQASLRDGRTVYYRGKRVDVTTHPLFRVAIDHVSLDYELAESPEHRQLLVAHDAELGEIARLYKPPRTADDLLERSAIVDLLTRRGGTMLTLIKEIGSDALFALQGVAAAMDTALSTKMLERVQAYRRHCAQNDLALCVAQSDPKGDRSLRPSEQEHPDYYLRIVERRDGGIVVRGAKVHTSNSMIANEMIVLPTRNLDERDKEYAVAFAVPMNAPGLKLITSTYTPHAESTFERPLSAKHRMLETLTVFDDVFVPWDRVFMDGQYQFAGALALGFVDYHRFTAVSYKQPLVDLLAGSALLMADMNGISRAGHVRDKLTWLISYAETLKAMIRAGAQQFQTIPPGLAVPNRMLVNIAKLQFATQYHTALAYVQDIAGGLLVTQPGEEDLRNPETGPYIEHYLGGRKGISAEDRLRAINLVSDLTTSEFGGYHAVLAIHAEGSIEAEKLAILRDYDVNSAMAYAREQAGIG